MSAGRAARTSSSAPDGKTWMAYHFWKDGPDTGRVVGIDPLVWNADVPYLLGPSRWSQPAPVDLHLKR